jgi:hypothetical protein
VKCSWVKCSEDLSNRVSNINSIVYIYIDHTTFLLNGFFIYNILLYSFGYILSFYMYSYCYVFLKLCICYYYVCSFVSLSILIVMFRSVYSVSLCCSVYCLCVNVYCAAATGISGHF